MLAGHGEHRLEFIADIHIHETKLTNARACVSRHQDGRLLGLAKILRSAHRLSRRPCR